MLDAVDVCGVSARVRVIGQSAVPMTVKRYKDYSVSDPN